MFGYFESNCDEVERTEDRTVFGLSHEPAKNSEPESEGVRAKSEFTKDFESNCDEVERTEDRDGFAEKSETTEDVFLNQIRRSIRGSIFPFFLFPTLIAFLALLPGSKSFVN